MAAVRRLAQKILETNDPRRPFDVAVNLKPGEADLLVAALQELGCNVEAIGKATAPMYRISRMERRAEPRSN